MSPSDPGVLAPSAPATLSPLTSPPSISVVIPVYQSALTVGRAIESALGQRTAPREVIVVDDGSTDALEDALAPFRALIRIERQENRGAAAARNAGTRLATGEYVAVLDADDTFEPNRLSTLTRLAMDRPDLDLITTDTRFLLDGAVAGSFLAANPFAVHNQPAAILRSCFVGGWPAVKRQRLMEIGGYDEDLRVAHDWDCWLRLILDGSRAGLIPEPLYNYALHDGTVTSNRRLALRDRVRLLEKARTNPGLRPTDHPALEASLREHRRRSAEAEVTAFLQGTGSARRMRELRGSKEEPPGVRVLAFAAIAAPWLVRRLLRAEPPPAERLRPAAP